MHTVFDDDYSTRLRALELSTERVKEHWQDGNSELAVIDAGNALNAVYDLHEAYFRHVGMRKMVLQDAHLEQSGGQLVGGLAVARGARAHDLVQFVRSGGYGELPYGMGPYGGGYVWTAHVWETPRYERRGAWYDQYVKWRALWQPFDEAWLWFSERGPAGAPKP